MHQRSEPAEAQPNTMSPEAYSLRKGGWCAGLLVAWVLALLLAQGAEAVPRIDAPCTACKAIATELQSRIDNEPVKNHLDMRHRLDATGKRYGRMIEYRVSELRAVELLEDLCDTMKSWTLVTVNGTDGQKTRHWEHRKKAGADSRPTKNEEDVRQKQLESWCGRVLEEHDEDITEAIQTGKMEDAGVAQWLCYELLKTCPPPAINRSASASDDAVVPEEDLTAAASAPTASANAEL